MLLSSEDSGLCGVDMNKSWRPQVLSLADGPLRVFHKLAVDWDFHARPSLGSLRRMGRLLRDDAEETGTGSTSCNRGLLDSWRWNTPAAAPVLTADPTGSEKMRN